MRLAALGRLWAHAKFGAWTSYWPKTETGEGLDQLDVELVRFEQEPNNVSILANIFRLVHTIKGTCGFLGLPRLEALTHAAEALMGKFREGMPVTG